ncbi:hypothetical protein DAI22_01g415150 [Oryza sativa Japonica Group]|nr:hypothetical protein DAI22_01g415150 [Oryza sativa Japonica Group]
MVLDGDTVSHAFLDCDRVLSTSTTFHRPLVARKSSGAELGNGRPPKRRKKGLNWHLLLYGFLMFQPTYFWFSTMFDQNVSLGILMVFHIFCILCVWFVDVSIDEI